MSGDLISRLRELHSALHVAAGHPEDPEDDAQLGAWMIERRATLEEAAQALAEAEAALEPFAATGAVLDAKPKDNAVWAGQAPAPPITFGDLRKAAATLSTIRAAGGDPPP